MAAPALETMPGWITLDLKKLREKVAKEDKEEEKRKRKLKAEQERLRLAAVKAAKVCDTKGGCKFRNASLRNSQRRKSRNRECSTLPETRGTSSTPPSRPTRYEYPDVFPTFNYGVFALGLPFRKHPFC